MGDLRSLAAVAKSEGHSLLLLSLVQIVSQEGERCDEVATVRLQSRVGVQRAAARTVASGLETAARIQREADRHNWGK